MSKRDEVGRPIGVSTASDWLPSKIALDRLVAACGSRYVAIGTLKRSLARGSVGSCTKTFLIEFNVGPIKRSYNRAKELLEFLDDKNLPGENVLEPLFWQSGVLGGRVYYSWNRDIFAYIEPNTTEWFKTTTGIIVVKPAKRTVAYNVHFLKKDIVRLISRLKRKRSAMQSLKPQNKKSKGRYNWPKLLEKLVISAKNGKLSQQEGIINSGKALQATIEEEIQTLSECSEATARRMAGILLIIDEAAQESGEAVSKIQMSLLGPFAPMIRPTPTNRS